MKQATLFEKQHNEVLRVLSILASRSKNQPVFIGGSAVQALLSKGRRFSIDLDLYYNGNATELVEYLLPEYELIERHSNLPIFEMFKVRRDGTDVKIDVSKFELLSKDTPFSEVEIPKSKPLFKCRVATVDYLLASKLSALAIGTVGRKQEKEMDFLKDVFDVNVLVDEFKVSNQVWPYFEDIIDVQNALRKTKFTRDEVVKSILARLFDVAVDSKHKLKGTVNSFNQNLSPDEYLETLDCRLLLYRVASYVSLAQRSNLKVVHQDYDALEDWVSHNFEDGSFLKKCKLKLENEYKEFPKVHLSELLADQPKALLYLYACFYTLETSLKDGIQDSGLRNDLKKGLKNGL